MTSDLVVGEDDQVEGFLVPSRGLGRIVFDEDRGGSYGRGARLIRTCVWSVSCGASPLSLPWDDGEATES